MGCRVLLKQDAVPLCLYGELATHGILDVADSGIEIVNGEPAHRGGRCQRDGEWSTREEEIRQPSIGRFLNKYTCHTRMPLSGKPGTTRSPTPAHAGHA